MKKRQPTVVSERLQKRRNNLTKAITTTLFLLLTFSTTLISQNILFDRTIGHTEHCNGVTVYSFYLNLDGMSSAEKLYQIQNGSMVEYDDGTAHITGIAVNNVHPTQKWNIDVTLSGRTFNSPAGSPKDHECNPTVTDDWYYYTAVTGSFLGLEEFAGAEIAIDRRGPAFQMGTGANVFELNSKFDGCGWHHLNFISQPDNGNTLSGADGDFNMSVSGDIMTEDQSCGGTITGYTITNGNDILNLTDGTTYFVSEIPAGAELSATVNGPHKSFKFNVSGLTNTQNTLPYSFNWNPTPGTYNINGQLFSEDNLEGTTCDFKTITITIIPDPQNAPEMILTLEEDQSFCAGDSIIITPTITNQSVCEMNCDLVGNNLIANYDMNDCAAFSNNGSAYSYDEFEAAQTDLNCATISTSKIYRFSGRHSCTDDHATQNNGDAICVGVPDLPAFEAQHEKAIRFDVSVAPNNGYAGLTGLSFKEFAPAEYVWSAEGFPDNTGINNYPTKFGIRILKSGVEIFRAEDIATSQNWETQNFDFTGLNDFKVNNITTFTIEMLAYELIGNGSSVSAWDIDDLQVFGGCCTPTTFDDVTYQWSNGATDAVLTANTAGSYSVTVTDCAGLTATDDIVLSTTEINATLTASNVSCAGGNDGTATATPTDGLAPFSYLWNTGNDNNNITDLTAGTYTVTITDANGCDFTEEIEITAPGELIVDSSIDQISCNGDTNGSIEAIATGGTAPYSFIWNNGSTDANIQNLSVGTYELTVTDNNGCEQISDYTIMEPEVLVITTTSNPVLCFGDGNGSASLTVNGGTSPYTYLWNNGNTDDNQSNLTAGVYDITVTDAEGCENMASVTIESPELLSSSIIVLEGVACFNGNNAAIETNTSGGTGTYSYEWNTGATTSSLNGLGAGTYTVSVYDENQCISTETVTLEAPEALVISIDFVDSLSCFGDTNGNINTITSGGSLPYSYLWNNGATTASVSNLAAGNYELTVTDGEGCTTQATVTINNPTELVIIEGDVVPVNCNGESTGGVYLITEGGTGTLSYNWSNGSTEINMLNVPAGSYTVTVTDTQGCTVSESYTITESEVFTYESFEASPSVSCAGSEDGFASISFAPNMSVDDILWSNGATTASISDLSPGIYSVTVTNRRGCTVSAETEISEPAELVATTENIIPVSCEGMNNGTATIAATGGTTAYTFSWSNGDTGMTAENLSAGTYTYTVTDNNACEATGTVTITSPEALELSNISTDALCNGEATGSIDATVSGGTAPYSFNWSNGENTEDLDNLEAGTYMQEVTDANGCVATMEVTIDEPTELSASAVTTDVSCAGGTDGLADITVQGGTLPYTFNWNNNAVSEDLENLSAGTYGGMITDANGCFVQLSFDIAEPEAILITVDSFYNPTCNDGTDAAIYLSITGGTPDYNILWSNDATTDDIEGLIAGTYSVTITDNNGCIETKEVTIEDPATLELMVNVMDIDCAGNENGQISLTVSGGNAPYNYIWSNGETTSTIGDLTPGTYSVSVNDNNGCGVEATYQIAEPAELTATSSVSHVRCFSGDDGLIEVIATGGTAPYAYQWSNGGNLPINEDVVAGTYSVTVYDANQCSFTTEVTVNEPALLNPYLIYSTDVDCFGGNNGSAGVDAVGGIAPYTYLWSNGATVVDLDDVSAGTYTLTVTDANNCINTLEVIIGEAEELDVDIYNTTAPSCFEGNDGTASVFVTGGNAPYSYNWSNGQTGTTSTGFAAGMYTMTITDASGCVKTGDFEITQPELLSATSAATDALCADSADGTISISPAGGTAPYTAIWENGTQGLEIAGLATGTYSATVSDANGCITVISNTIGSPDPIFVNPEITNKSCLGLGSIELMIGGGVSPYAINWSNGDTTNFNKNLEPANYNVTITDANNCSVSFGYGVIGQADLEIQNVGIVPVRCNGESTGRIRMDVTGGLTPYDILWSNGETTEALENLVAGEYSVTVNDFQGCTVVDTFIVGAAPELAGAIEITQLVSAPGMSDAVLTAMIEGGFPGYTYLWNTGATTEVVENIAAGDYSLTVTDNFDCTQEYTVTVAEGIDCSNVNAVINTDRSFCQHMEASFTADQSGDSTTIYTWAFFDGEDNRSEYLGTATGNRVGFTFEVYGSKLVELTVTASNGCVAVTEQLLEISENVTYGGTIDGNESNCQAFDPAVISSIELPGSGRGDYEYVWMYSDQPEAPVDMNDRNWILLPDATRADYTPDFVEITTYFVRFGKSTGCDEFVASNVISKEVNDPGINAGIEVNSAICIDTDITFLATDGGRSAVYNWNFFSGNSSRGGYLGSRDGQSPDFSFSRAGEIYVELTISLPDGCVITTDSVFTVEESDSSNCRPDGRDVSITSFDLLPYGDNQVLAFWDIANEERNVNYEVERSSDGGNTFEIIGAVPGDGNGSYLFVDEFPLPGYSDYRLKVILPNGDLLFSDPVNFFIESSIEGYTYPNPATSSTFLRLNEPLTSDVQMELTDNQGNIIDLKVVSAGTSEVFWDLSRLISGRYYIYAIDNGRRTLISDVMKID